MIEIMTKTLLKAFNYARPQFPILNCLLSVVLQKLNCVIENDTVIGGNDGLEDIDKLVHEIEEKYLTGQSGFSRRIAERPVPHRDKERPEGSIIQLHYQLQEDVVDECLKFLKSLRLDRRNVYLYLRFENILASDIEKL